MNIRKRIIAGVIALAIGMTAALPMTATADSDDWHHHDYHAWHHHDYRDWHNRDHDDDDYYRYGNRAYPPAPAYAYRHKYVPPNGEGMINRRNPNFRWACDSEGHHCHWARR